MKFDSLISTIKAIGINKQLWLSNETLNELAKVKDFRVKWNNNLLICSNNVEIEISINEELISNCAVCFARIKRVSDMFEGTKLIKNDIYFTPRLVSQKEAKSIIL